MKSAFWGVDGFEKMRAEKNKRFKIVTLGCKVNQYESAYLRDALREAGYAEASKRDRAQLVIVNTCIVTGKASYQSRQAVRRAVKENPGAVIAAVGCYGQSFPEELAEIKGLDLIAGNTVKGGLVQVLTDFKKVPKPFQISGNSSPARRLISCLSRRF